MSNGTGTKTRVPRRRVAIGPKRPQYLASPEIDRVLMIVTALTAEVSALRDRLATHEALAATDVAATAQSVEAYRPDADATASRDRERTAMLRRVYRVITEELDAVRQSEADGAADGSMAAERDKT